MASALLLAAFVDAGVSGAASHHLGIGAPFELFVHPMRGGAWSSHLALGTSDQQGTLAPTVVASGGELVIVQRAGNGDVDVAEGSLQGHFTSVDLAAADGAPPAAGRPAAWAGPGGAAAVWYRTSAGQLEVATQAHQGGAWTIADVTALTGGTPIGGDPTVPAGGQFPGVGYAVTDAGSVSSFQLNKASGWVQTDPTGGLSFPSLAGPVTALRAPGVPPAQVLLGTTSSGDVVELSDELAGPLDAVGPWRATDLTELGLVPGALGPLDAVGGAVPDAAYRSWSGDEVALHLTSGFADGVVVRDLTVTTELVAAPNAVPTLVLGPEGPSVAARTLTGDLTLTPVVGRPIASDLSFQPATEQLISSDAGATSVGKADVLVAADAGWIAPSPLLRRIVLRAASYDQQHRFFRTVPNGSYCNPFTAAYGRGSTAGCRRGYAAEEWCSDYAQWVWALSGVNTSGITAWAATFVTWGAARHRVQYGTHFAAQPGDAILWGTRSPLYATHVAIIVGVKGRYLDVVGGDSWGNLPGYGIGVWRTGAFPGASSSVSGYHVLGVVTP